MIGFHDIGWHPNTIFLLNSFNSAWPFAVAKNVADYQRIGLIIGECYEHYYTNRGVDPSQGVECLRVNLVAVWLLAVLELEERSEEMDLKLNPTLQLHNIYI